MSGYLTCCFHFSRQSNQSHQRKFDIRSIDKSMIGLPTNFQHCAHIGCSDVNTIDTSNINTVDSSTSSSTANKAMKTKGLSSFNLQNNSQFNRQQLVAHLKLIDLKVS